MAGKERYTKHQIIEALIETKGLVSLAAKKLGCSHNVIYDYKKKYPEVAAVFDEQRTALVDVAELSLFKAIQKGEPWAVALVLKTIGKGRGYVERQEIENSGDMTVTVKYETE